jgi:hypothetical protein
MSSTDIDEGFDSGVAQKADYPRGRFNYEDWKNGRGPSKIDDDEDEADDKKVVKPKRRRSFSDYVKEARAKQA